MNTDYDLVIIGGGASGLILLANLNNKASTPLHVALINAGYPTGKGIAYSTENNNHLLNVRVSRMSAFIDDNNHFTNWILAQPHYTDYHTENLGERFVPRKMYGEYLNDLLESIKKKSGHPMQLDIIHDTAVDTYREGDGFMVALKKNTSVSSKKVVLCTGNQPPVTLPGIIDLKTTNDIYINPWDEKAVENIHPDKPVFIIGSGLTMVDTVISLVDQGFKNKIIVLSKHGAIPMAHPKVRVVAPHPEQAPPADLHIIYKNLKSQIRSAIDHTEWHEPVLEAVRPFTQKIWQEMPLEQKHRFLRHINHRWAKLRHRLPHEVHDLIQSMIDKGQIELYAGKLSAVQYANQTLNVSFYNRAKDVTVQCEVQRIINCIGPEGDFEKVDNPLLQNMLKSGIIDKDPLSFGFNATGDGKIINRNGIVEENLFAIGSGLRGILWESTAIPEIRVQAHQLAERLLS